MNILVTGANGQLGNEMRIVTQQSRDRYIFTDVTEAEGLTTAYLDMTDEEAVRSFVSEHDVEMIINSAAYTDVNGAESRQDLAEKLNAEAPRILAEAMRAVGGVLIHISTDYVFGGSMVNTPCAEEQKGEPTGVYGQTKLRGEENIIATGCHYLIFRTAWLYSEFGKNFVKTMMALTHDKPELKVVFDQCGTPTYAYDLAAAIYAIIENRQFAGNDGVYHFSNEGVTSWYDFTRVIARIAGNTAMDADGSVRLTCDVQPCHSDEFPSPVVRPSFSVLDKTKYKKTFGRSVPYWMDSLEVCIKRMNK